MKLDFPSVMPPIAYRPDFAHITKSVKAGVLLSQFLYWRGKGKTPNGWVYKRIAELSAETGLTSNEIRSARTRLKNLGLIEEKQQGIPPTVYFRLDVDKLRQLYGEYGNNLPEYISKAYEKWRNRRSKKSKDTSDTTPYINSQRDVPSHDVYKNRDNIRLSANSTPSSIGEILAHSNLKRYEQR